MPQAELDSSEGLRLYQVLAWEHHSRVTSSPAAPGIYYHRLLPSFLLLWSQLKGSKFAVWSHRELPCSLSYFYERVQMLT